MSDFPRSVVLQAATPGVPQAGYASLGGVSLGSPTLGPGSLDVWGNHPTVPWKFHSYSTTFNGVRDDIFSIGFNVWNQDDAAKAGMSIQMENDYYAGGVHSSEFMFAWQDTDGTGRRPWQVNVTYGTRAVQHLVNGNVRIYNSAQTGNPSFDFLDGGFLEIQTPGGITGSNNYQFYKQKNSSAVDTTLLYLTSGNRLDIAPSGVDSSIGGSLYIGGASSPVSLIDVGGTVAPAAGYAAVRFHPTVNPTGATDVYAIYNAPIIGIPAAAATSSVQGFRLDIPDISLGAGASLSYATTLYIQGAPTEAANNYALYVDGSSSQNRVSGKLGVGGDPAGRFSITGVSDEVQLYLKANGTQTSKLMEVRSSAGAIWTHIDGAGRLGILSGGAAQTQALYVGSSSFSGATAAFFESNDGSYATVRVANSHGSGWGVYDTSYKAYFERILLNSPGAFVSGDKYLVIDASGNIHKSALGPAS